MLYPWNYVNKINNRIIWVTQKSIEVEENRALKKEEQKEKIRKNNLLNYTCDFIKEYSHTKISFH